MVQGAAPGHPRIPACQRCHSRKTKCDSQVPSCQNCVKAGVECMHYDKILGKPLARRHIWSLEERMKILADKGQVEKPSPGTARQESHERDLDEAGRNRINSRDSVHVLQLSIDQSSEVQSEELGLLHEGSGEMRTDIHHNHREKRRRLSNQSSWSALPLVDDSSTSSLSDDDMEVSNPNSTDAFLITTSTGGERIHYNEELASEIRQYSTSFADRGASETFIKKENAAIAKLGQDFLKVARKNTVRNRVTDITAYKTSMLLRLSKRYFVWMNSAYPVLHEYEFYDLVKRCQKQPKQATVLEFFQLNMVFAIALASLSRPRLTTSELGHVSRAFWKAASRTLSRAIGDAEGLKKLQNVLLLLQYTLLVPKAGNLWQLSGSAMTLATEMSLFAQPNPAQNFDPLTLDLRRRAFWTCYCIDRTLSTTMGRPTSIPEEWITAKMPALVEDKLIKADGIYSGPTCCLKIALVHQVRICRLQSEIHGRLYAPIPTKCSNQEEEKAWTWQTYDKLRTWRSSFLYPTPLVTKEWTELQFHIAVVLLLRPSPNRPNPSIEETHVALHSAGESMKLMKIMHRDGSAVFVWLTVQNLFMCGLTFVNSLKKLTKDQMSESMCIPFVEIILQVQACTSILETLSTLEAGEHEKIRNVFEIASSNILHELSKQATKLQGLIAKGGHCAWDLLAKSDNINLQRPTVVDGIEIPIENDASFLHLTDCDETTSISIDETHFYEHDVDASSRSDAGHSRLGSNPPDPNQHPVIIERQGHAESLFNAASTSLSQLNLRGTSLHIAGETNPEMSALTAFSAIASEANPISSTDIPDWYVGDSSTDLERWFLYPI
ncbi:hypothetical protein QFC19_003422 [Naganishia cerealis]|uniref:Uncharacterized protein n=1 Tax=Naganishia cerealis TaxID=610337 RepID=A0ACC2W2W5_9TREE|nr:hypothetical protein QFC19_003422 [Naganishia cerealis]